MSGLEVVPPIALFIAGAEKAGTSSLARYLEQHPLLRGHAQREFMYFVDDTEHDGGYDAAFTRYFGAPDDRRLVAKNVGAMYAPAAPARMKAHNPAMHVVVVLRDPVSRAWSAYWYNRRMGRESLASFEQAIAAEPARLAKGGDAARYGSYLDRGVYLPQVTRLVSCFGRQQVHIVLYDQLAAEPLGVTGAVFDAMGLPPFTPDISVRHNRAAAARFPAVARLLSSPAGVARAIAKLLPRTAVDRVKRRLRKANEMPFTPPSMSPETHERLQRHYAPHNDALAAFLGRELPWR